MLTAWYVCRFALVIFSRHPLIFQFLTLQVPLHTFKARHHHQPVFCLSPKVPCLVFDQCILQVRQLHRVLHLFLHIQLAVLMDLPVWRRVLQSLYSLALCRWVPQVQLPPEVSSIPHRCRQNRHHRCHQEASAVPQWPATTPAHWAMDSVSQCICRSVHCCYWLLVQKAKVSYVVELTGMVSAVLVESRDVREQTFRTKSLPFQWLHSHSHPIPIWYLNPIFSHQAIPYSLPFPFPFDNSTETSGYLWTFFSAGSIPVLSAHHQPTVLDKLKN